MTSNWSEIDEISMKIDLRIYEYDEMLNNEKMTEEKFIEIQARRKGLREAWRIIQENKR